MEFRFHGGAGEVGGSCIEVRSRGIRVALDYGIKIEDEVRFDKLPEKLDAAYEEERLPFWTERRDQT